MSEVILKSKIRPEQVAAIGISNQRETSVLWDAYTGLPVSPAIVWQSKQTKSICDDWKEKGYEDIVKAKTGLRIDPYFSASKIRFIFDQNPDVYEKAKKGEVLFGTMDSWIVWKLSGSLTHITDVSNASRTLLFNIHTLSWDEELLESETMRKFGNSEFSDKPINLYNLDMIISVGYRVKSKNGIIFRKWATSVLKDYMIKGYAVNQKRLEYLEKTIKLIDIAGRMDAELKGSEAWEIIKVINNYSSALSLLDDYDHKRITKPIGTKNDKQVTYEDCMNIIGKLKFNSDSNLFALERNEGLKEVIGTIYQSFDGKDLYSTIEEKAANFLYLITKNHTFIDGNKRIAATLFIYFLEFYNILYNENGQVIDNNTLVAITLLIAQSNPKEKEILIDLVMNFLNNN